MLAIIPARGSSKGLVGKNIKLLLGKPLIAYTIEAAQQSKSIDKIVLSTDSPQIAEVARKYDIEIPFMRPEELAADASLAIETYLYTVERLNSEFKYNINEFIVLQPTSPLRTFKDIDCAINVYFEKEADSVISVCEAPYPPYWAKKISAAGGLLNYFDSEVSNINRQDIVKAFIPNGAIYIFKLSLLKKHHSYYSTRTFPYVMPRERSIDIDDLFDFEITEYLLRKK
jgi:CMP-N,N'-diacetyllegionaminic acid synthase